jgi:hypothetical protein
MMIGRWLQGVLGVNALVEELRAERLHQREIMIKVLQTSEQQAEAIKAVSSIIEGIYKAYETDGTPPREFHRSEEQEDEIITRAWYGPTEPD